MTWMSHECLSKVHWSETKSHLPIVTGKTTWCPASYKRIISLFPTLHKHWFCCGHIQTLCLPKEVRVVQEARALCGLVSFCFSILLLAVFYPLLYDSLCSCPDWGHLQCPRVSQPGLSLSGFIPEQAVPPASLLPRPWQVCLITSAKIISWKELMTNILRVLSLSPFPYE